MAFYTGFVAVGGGTFLNADVTDEFAQVVNDIFTAEFTAIQQQVPIPEPSSILLLLFLYSILFLSTRKRSFEVLHGTANAV